MKARVALLVCAIAATHVAASHAATDAAVEPNDNRRSAGTADGSTLTVALRASAGRWQPEGPAGPTLEIEAFGEVGQPLMVPAPLIRVVEGMHVAVSVRNELSTPLVVHGLCTQGGVQCVPLKVPSQESRDVRFASGPAGTYHYWATTVGAPVPFRELAGAFVVDPAGAPREPDRVLVITEWSDLTGSELRDIVTADVPGEAFVKVNPRVTFVINGRSWPATERFTYQLGERVHWRVINLSSQSHPMHLHGFYFDVNSLGDGTRDTIFDEQRLRRVVTQVLSPGATMTMTWTPERAGNWLFHCHVMHHVSPERRITPARAAPHVSDDHAGHESDAGGGMAGMVIGVTVPSRAAERTPRVVDEQAWRRITVRLQPTPGSTLVLQRGQPVEITLVNELAQATAIHWHGIELESFYDGVHGWSGVGQRITPMIEPGGSFVVRFTPPRAGTFIYHTHVHDYRQLSAGLYGALVVVDANETFDPVTDHVVVLGRHGLTSADPSILTAADSVVINGERTPRLVWKAGTRHRVRVINITPDDIFDVTLQTSDGLVTWTPVAKDGVPVPVAESVPTPARQRIAVGETYDFSFEASAGRKTAWLEVRTPGGKWQGQGHVIIK